MSVAAIIVAAGRGSRAGEGPPKQYRSLAGEPVLTRTLRVFLTHPSIDSVVPVIHPEDRSLYEESSRLLPRAAGLYPPRHGGRTRQASVLSGLEALVSSPPDVVLVHDAARPFASAGLDGFTDDGALAEWAGLSVEIFEGDPGNVKLTHAGDFDDAERRLGGAMDYVTRIGTGFDVHAFTEGDHVWLGGVRVPHSRGVLAHSDGDVVLHALTDALLGALAEGDIGVHFPPSDPEWRGAPSARFLAYAAEKVRLRDGLIDHLDVTLLCEAP